MSLLFLMVFCAVILKHFLDCLLYSHVVVFGFPPPSPMTEYVRSQLLINIYAGIYVEPESSK